MLESLIQLVTHGVEAGAAQSPLTALSVLLCAALMNFLS
ncbi:MULTISPECIES: YshB family small membrane protein [Tenebrionibacter/Tenebrionicola group]|jgi:hypothetical protein|uniref:YshB family small membrane protein n=2 Tax=Tenebrionibacter/Tenebrionicola group TaxID=2969848 RepID=A0A8K0XXI8_9ENTR|nr:MULTISPECIES: YshB family small membrane protein [Tenebrionibacter/Tenebrionicola group]MBK4715412.1 YshB family small membrane protein [Tenebrionibacter intestinalis]MBV4413952.1 YshB family small membrane protein [Tenebrionicola larvae]MBV5096080.1 YshB family small membrane protein [Tenebrionicola larvae]